MESVFFVLCFQRREKWEVLAEDEHKNEEKNKKKLTYTVKVSSASLLTKTKNKWLGGNYWLQIIISGSLNDAAPACGFFVLPLINSSISFFISRPSVVWHFRKTSCCDAEPRETPSAKTSREKCLNNPNSRCRWSSVTAPVGGAVRGNSLRPFVFIYRAFWIIFLSNTARFKYMNHFQSKHL